jgi:nitrous oxidase accessory protein NosD
MTRQEILFMATNTLRRSIVLGVLLLPVGAAVEAETVNCTPITSLPAVISSQGVYCLTGHLATGQTSGSAMTIVVPNVVLDLNGWKLGGQGAGKGTAATGISSDQANLTIKNGTVRGFRYGISLSGAGAVVEDILADQNTMVGIRVDGEGSVVRRNQIVKTGGSTVAPNTWASGISSQASGVLIEENTVSGLYPVGTGTAVGIEMDGADNSVVRGNAVSGSTTPPAGYGIHVRPSSGVAVVANAISSFDVGVYYDPAASGIYARNVADGCTTKYSGGTAGTGND